MKQQFNTGNVYILMRRKGITQKELAERLGISTTWANIILQRGFWDSFKVEKLAEILGVTVKEITKGA